MRSYTKSSTAIKEKSQEELPDLEVAEPQSAKIIPWPDVQHITKKAKPHKKKDIRLEGKYLHLHGKKIPILHFQKSGYDKLLKLLVKEIER